MLILEVLIRQRSICLISSRKPTGTLSYVRDESEYYVDITTEGIFTIKKVVNDEDKESELTKDSSGSYIFPNERALNGQITIIKKWNDGKTDAERETPKIHLKRTDSNQTIKGINITVEWRNDTTINRPSSKGGIVIHILNKKTNQEYTSDNVSQASGNVWTYSFPDIELSPEDQYIVYENGAEDKEKMPDGYHGSAVGKNAAINVHSGRATIVNTFQLTYDFDYTGKVQTFTAPMDGKYKLEVWGAQGGTIYEKNSAGGKGGYSTGYIDLTRGTTLYVSVGGSGTYSIGAVKSAGGWNGGGDGKWNQDSTGSPLLPHTSSVGSGGGATSIQDKGMGDGQLKNYSNDKGNVIIVAGGGGGGDYWPGSNQEQFGAGGAGGGKNGLAGNGAHAPGTGGTDSKGGTYSLSSNYPGDNISNYVSDGGNGKFGQGGSYLSLGVGSAGGGGGWYGGGASIDNAGGGGGSGHIGNRVEKGETIDGGKTFPSPNGGNEQGHSNNGYARITIQTDNNTGLGENFISTASSTSSMEYAAELSTDYVTENGLNELGGWKSLDDNTWEYKLNVFDDNATYEISEGLMSGYTSSFDNSVEKKEDDSYMVDCSKNKVITVTNTMRGQYGSLKVSKTVMEKDKVVENPSQYFNFTVTLSGDSIKSLAGSSIQIRLGDTFFKIDNGSASINIKLHGGESKTFTNLPVGTQYKVTEEPVVNYNNYKEGDTNLNSATYEKTGDITTDHLDASANFTNTFVRPKLSRVNITLKKVVTGTIGGTDNAEYPFTAYFTNLEKNMDYEVEKNDKEKPYFDTIHSNENGTAFLKFSMKKDQVLNFKDLPETATYQFTEEAGDWVPSYTVTNDGNTGAIAKAKDDGITQKNVQLSTASEVANKDEKTTVTFSNHIERKQTLTLAMQTEYKRVGKAAIIDNTPQEEFAYVISFTSLPKGSVINNAKIGNITADEYGEAVKEITLKAGEKIVITGIPAGAEYKITQKADDRNGTSKYRGFTAHYEIATYDFAGKKADKEEGGQGSPGIVQKSGKAVRCDAELSTQNETVDEGYNDEVIFTNRRYDQTLPNTGGEGTRLYTFMMILLAGAFVAFTVAARQKKFKMR